MSYKLRPYTNVAKALLSGKPTTIAEIVKAEPLADGPRLSSMLQNIKNDLKGIVTSERNGREVVSYTLQNPDQVQAAIDEIVKAKELQREETAKAAEARKQKLADQKAEKAKARAAKRLAKAEAKAEAKVTKAKAKAETIAAAQQDALQKYREHLAQTMGKSLSDIPTPPAFVINETQNQADTQPAATASHAPIKATDIFDEKTPAKNGKNRKKNK